MPSRELRHARALRQMRIDATTSAPGAKEARGDGDWLPGQRRSIGPVPAEPPGAFSDGMHTILGENPKDRAGASKPQLHLVPPSALIHMARVFELGAAKYGPYNWRDNAVRFTVYISAAMRHLGAMLDGEMTDPESGEPHAAHVADCMAILMDAADTGNLIDDRPQPGATSRLLAGKPA